MWPGWWLGGRVDLGGLRGEGDPRSSLFLCEWCHQPIKVCVSRNERRRGSKPSD